MVAAFPKELGEAAEIARIGTWSIRPAIMYSILIVSQSYLRIDHIFLS